MPLKPYRPTINVLYVGGDSQSREMFSKLLFKQNIYAYTVAAFSDAGKILKTHAVDIVLFDPVYQSFQEKDFSVLAKLIKTHHARTLFIVWADSEAVLDFCRRKKILIFDKAAVDADAMAKLLAEKLMDISGFSGFVKSHRFENYYSEPGTILAIFMAMDMRTALFKATAGLNYGPIITEMKDGLFTLYVDPTNDTAVSQSICKKILHKNYFPEIERNVRIKSKQLVVFSRSLRGRDYSGVSNKSLGKLYLEFCHRFMAMRAYTSLPTALEHLSNVWTGLLKGILVKKISDTAELNEVLSTMTSPEKISYVTEFETAVARVGLLRSTGEAFEAEAVKVAEKFAWIHYTFEGTPITARDVLEKTVQLGNTSEDFETFIEGQRKRLVQVALRKKEIIKKYGLTKREVELFRIGAEIVFIKYFRKGIFAESYYSVEFLLEAIALRVGSIRKTLVNMFPGEVLSALQFGTFPVEIIESRMKRSVVWSLDGRSYPLGPTAHEKYQNSIIQVKIQNEIKGQVAQIGKVSGVVKIVNTADDMKKMNEGDILVSRSTNPSLITAMRQAGAFVTDIGGLTCHAAIVAREMKKPCVVGTKTATQVLKDGDVVEVDAERGIVKIIKKK